MGPPFEACGVTRGLSSKGVFSKVGRISLTAGPTLASRSVLEEFCASIPPVFQPFSTLLKRPLPITLRVAAYALTFKSWRHEQRQISDGLIAIRKPPPCRTLRGPSAPHL